MELHRMTWSDARSVLNENAVALLPVGSTEQHGPHLPLGTDTLTAEAVARRACELGPWIQLPAVPVGVSGHHRQFWGTLWVEPKVLKDYVRGIAESLQYHGVQRLLLVNGHGGNTPALEETARQLRKQGTATYVYVWWRAAAEVIAEVVTTGGSHAGEMETSVVLATEPELVRSARYGEAQAGAAETWGRQLHGTSIAFDTVDFSDSGCVGDPRPASAEKGERMLHTAAHKLHALCTWVSERKLDQLLPKHHLP
ncbi:MAG: creatininase family protein [Candidatus Bipolaricaulota bacterium]